MQVVHMSVLALITTTLASGYPQSPERSSLLLHRRVCGGPTVLLKQSCLCPLCITAKFCRLSFTDKYSDPSGVFNPAAVWHPDKGWLLLFRWDSCFYQRCGVSQTGSKALVSQIPTYLNPSSWATDAVQKAEVWEFDARSHLPQENATTNVTAGDFRPFLHKGDVYLGHWLKFGWTGADVPEKHTCWSTGWGSPHSCEYSSISRLDFKLRRILLVYQFERPLIGRHLRPEKNWAFLDWGGELLLFYSLFPCTTVFRFSPSHPRGASLKDSFCYTNATELEKNTGHSPKASRLSGNPVQWTPAGGSPTLLAMVHSRAQHSYSHWLVCLHRQTLKVTHVSAGPVLKSSWFALEGHIRGVLVVGSFHVLWTPAESVLRVFVGEGDQYAGWHDISIDLVAWYAVNASSLQHFTTEEGVMGFLESTEGLTPS